jgi:hypothetical protein
MTPARWRYVLRVAVKGAQRRVGNVIADVDGDDANTRIFAAWGMDEIVYAEGAPEALYRDLAARPAALDEWLRPIATIPGRAEAMLAEQEARSTSLLPAIAPAT